jgi:rhamnulokinase
MTRPGSGSDGERVYLAVDLGAGSGRVMAGRWDGSRLALDEVHRFEVTTVAGVVGLFWDLPAIWASVRDGLRAAARRYPAGSVRSIGVDSWAVDYGYLDRSGQLLRLPHHYRDPRTGGLVGEVTRQVPAARIFGATGVQFLPSTPTASNRTAPKTAPAGS